VDYVDRSRPTGIMRVPLQVTSLDVEDYRSRWSLFDVLFRSNARGTIYGRPFEIASDAASDAPHSVFTVSDLPLSLLGQRITVPLGGQVTGRVDANIRTQWQSRDESTELKMHCNLVAHSFTLHMPNGLVQRAMAPTVASRVPSHMPMEFDLVMDKRAFDGQTSFFATGILESIGKEASRQRRTTSPRPSTRSNNVFRRFGAGIRSLVSPRGR
jgi:hypothetical protein